MNSDVGLYTQQLLLEYIQALALEFQVSPQNILQLLFPSSRGHQEHAEFLAQLQERVSHTNLRPVVHAIKNLLSCMPVIEISQEEIVQLARKLSDEHLEGVRAVVTHFSPDANYWHDVEQYSEGHEEALRQFTELIVKVSDEEHKFSQPLQAYDSSFKKKVLSQVVPSLQMNASGQKWFSLVEASEYHRELLFANVLLPNRELILPEEYRSLEPYIEIKSKKVNQWLTRTLFFDPQFRPLLKSFVVEQVAAIQDSQLDRVFGMLIGVAEYESEHALLCIDHLNKMVAHQLFLQISQYAQQRGLVHMQRDMIFDEVGEADAEWLDALRSGFREGQTSTKGLEILDELTFVWDPVVQTLRVESHFQDADAKQHSVPIWLHFFINDEGEYMQRFFLNQELTIQADGHSWDRQTQHSLLQYVAYHFVEHFFRTACLVQPDLTPQEFREQETEYTKQAESAEQIESLPDFLSWLSQVTSKNQYAVRVKNGKPQRWGFSDQSSSVEQDSHENSVEDEEIWYEEGFIGIADSAQDQNKKHSGSRKSGNIEVVTFHYEYTLLSSRWRRPEMRDK